MWAWAVGCAADSCSDSVLPAPLGSSFAFYSVQHPVCSLACVALFYPRCRILTYSFVEIHGILSARSDGFSVTIWILSNLLIILPTSALSANLLRALSVPFSELLQISIITETHDCSTCYTKLYTFSKQESCVLSKLIICLCIKTYTKSKCVIKHNCIYNVQPE